MLIFFLASPFFEIYPDIKQNAYIIELKYAKYKDSESRVEELRLKDRSGKSLSADS